MFSYDKSKEPHAPGPSRQAPRRTGNAEAEDAILPSGALCSGALQALQRSAGNAAVSRILAQRAAPGASGPARSVARPQAAQTLHVQRAPGSSSDEFDDGGISAQDLSGDSRARFITFLHGEFVRSNQWDCSATQGRGNTITHFTA